MYLVRSRPSRPEPSEDIESSSVADVAECWRERLKRPERRGELGEGVSFTGAKPYGPRCQFIVRGVSVSQDQTGMP